MQICDKNDRNCIRHIKIQIIIHTANKCFVFRQYCNYNSKLLNESIFKISFEVKNNLHRYFLMLCVILFSFNVCVCVFVVWRLFCSTLITINPQFTQTEREREYTFIYIWKTVISRWKRIQWYFECQWHDCFTSGNQQIYFLTTSRTKTTVFFCFLCQSAYRLHVIKPLSTKAIVFDVVLEVKIIADSICISIGKPQQRVNLCIDS